MKYHYVVFLPWTEYASVMYADLKKMQNVTLVKKPFENSVIGRILEAVYRIHMLSRFQKYLPFKSIWNRLLFRIHLDNRLDYCFIFFMSDLKKSKRCFFNYLKRRSPNSKFVMYFEDTVQSRSTNGRTSLDFDYLSDFFDLTISYDKGDSEKYGYLYYPTPYSKINICSIEDNNAQSDLFFCGLAKDRHGLISQIYDQCLNNGLQCDFLVSSLPKDEEKNRGISYFDGMMPYFEYLKHLGNSKCILEINQRGAVGFTLRVWEALVYGKKLITNNVNILNAPFYTSNQFCYIEDSSKIPIDFLRKEAPLQSRYTSELSPIRMIEFIESKLNFL